MAKKEIERLKSPQTVIECHRQKRIETLESALAARDVIIGEKDAFIRGMKQFASPEMHNVMDEALSPSPNEVAEAVEGMWESMRKPCYCPPANWYDKAKREDNGHMSDCPQKEALALYDNALKGIK